MYIEQLIIESTRRCNLCCEHCLRGDAENKDMRRETMEDLLLGSEITYVGTVTFTGGEPSLYPEAITDFVEICKENNIEVGNFYIATNGTQAPEDFMIAVIKLYSLCSDNEMSQLEISRSTFHDCFQVEDDIKRLKAFSFTSERNYLEYNEVRPEGRGIDWAELNGFIDDVEGYNVYPLEYEEGYGFSGDGVVYLNVNGDVVTCCDLSYERQEEEKIGNVGNQTLIEMVENS